MMNKELFGVFGPPAAFRRFRSDSEFDRIVSTDAVTVGIRDPALDVPNRSAAYADEAGLCVVWGEAYLPSAAGDRPARWVRDRYADAGTEALSRLNGSYLVCVGSDEPTVYTDPIRSWECFYTDDPGVRVFGTDAMEVARTIAEPTIAAESLLELAHMSIVLGDRTVFEELHRIPFDGYLTGIGAGTLDRFVYRPRSFDYADELANRLERALDRRTALPGRKGLLLGAGYDSRLMLSGVPDVEACFTVGLDDAREVSVARQLAAQYGVDHRTIPIDTGYMDLDAETIRYTNGIGESIHIHHRGVEDIASIDTMYHGWAVDSLLKGFFVPKKRVGAFGKSIMLSTLADDPDHAGFLIDRRLGIMPDSFRLLDDCDAIDVDAETFLRGRLERELDVCRERCDREHNVANAFGIKHLPSKSFRTHLADHYLESFVCADSELIDWHLATPPEHRTPETYLEAIRQIDPEILRHRPPDRPRSVSVLNQIEGFVRRHLRGMEAFGRPWPDRDRLYDRYGLDETLFPDTPTIHPLNVRLKLRVHDTRTWLNAVVTPEIPPEGVLCPEWADRIAQQPHPL